MLERVYSLLEIIDTELLHGRPYQSAIVLFICFTFPAPLRTLEVGKSRGKSKWRCRSSAFVQTAVFLIAAAIFLRWSVMGRWGADLHERADQHYMVILSVGVVSLAMRFGLAGVLLTMFVGIWIRCFPDKSVSLVHLAGKLTSDRPGILKLFRPPAFLFSPRLGHILDVSLMLAMTRALTLVKASAVLTAFRLALVVPTAVSALVWNEPLTELQAAGALLALVALVLMTRDAGALLHLGNTRNLALVLLVFCLQGTSLTCLRWVQYAGIGGDQPKFLMVTGLVAGSWGALYLLVNRRRPQKSELATGAGIGLYNLAALMVILTALSQVPGTVFFPMMGCTVVVLDNLAARFLWKERLSPATLAGIALALAAICITL